MRSPPFLLAMVLASAPAAGADPCPILAADSGLEWTHQEGPDFDLCYAHAPGDEGHSPFGLYIGYYPQFRGRTDMAGEKGEVAGHEVEWFPRTGKDGDFAYGQETLLELPQRDGQPLRVHVWTHAQTPEERRAARAALAAMRFRDE